MITTTEELREKAMKWAMEVYPMANEDDFPENPNVNRLNNACVGAFASGFDYCANKALSTLTEQNAKLKTSLYDLVRAIRNETDGKGKMPRRSVALIVKLRAAESLLEESKPLNS